MVFYCIILFFIDVFSMQFQGIPFFPCKPKHTISNQGAIIFLLVGYTLLIWFHVVWVFACISFFPCFHCTTRFSLIFSLFPFHLLNFDLFIYLVLPIHNYLPKSNSPNCCSWNATYECLLGTNKRFPQPIPLSVSHLQNYCFFQIFLILGIRVNSTLLTYWLDQSKNWQEMVDFLVDIWEQEGLYDWECW